MFFWHYFRCRSIRVVVICLSFVGDRLKEKNVYHAVLPDHALLPDHAYRYLNMLFLREYAVFYGGTPVSFGSGSSEVATRTFGPRAGPRIVLA